MHNEDKKHGFISCEIKLRCIRNKNIKYYKDLQMQTKSPSFTKIKIQDSILRNPYSAWRWWRTPLIPALGRQRQDDLYELETILV